MPALVAAALVLHVSGSVAQEQVGDTAVGHAAGARTIVELQPFRQTSVSMSEAGETARRRATLVNLNPGINAWFLLTLGDAGQEHATTYHLENPDPREQQLELGAGGDIRLEAAGRVTDCAIWSGAADAELEEARRSNLPFAPLCNGRLYLRNPVPGNRTSLEAVTEFLRDHVWGGERVIGFVKRELFRDVFEQRPAPADAQVPPAAASDRAPAPALVSAEYEARAFIPGSLGIDLGEADRGVVLGQWYEARGLPGVYVSTMQPAALVGLGARGQGQAWRPDAVEAEALSYLIAFDLSRFDVGFTLGTEHPRLGWSGNVLDDVREPGLPGPDGIDTSAPLVRAGMLPPWLETRAVATFTGGLKREQGAFRYGALAQRDHGSHYGFVEQGVVFSRLVPGLATLFVTGDGTVDMKTWTGDDEALLPAIRDARQNGVALVEPDPVGGVPVPGALVGRWGPGNWSGSAKGQLRTLRAGACLIAHASTRFLVYGYFSTATPPTMARVFQAYGCYYAMHLDMNALEHTYLALYRRQGSQIEVEHLVEGMSQLDKQSGGAVVPRFLGFPDDRDFFYLLRRIPER